jgi:hypothetical protein
MQLLASQGLQLTQSLLYPHTAILPAVPAPCEWKIYLKLATFENRNGSEQVKNNRHLRFSRQ